MDTPTCRSAKSAQPARLSPVGELASGPCNPRPRCWTLKVISSSPGRPLRSEHTYLSVGKVGATGQVVSSWGIGVGSVQPQAAVLDAQGNLIIAGQTAPSGFPLTGALIDRKSTRL